MSDMAYSKFTLKHQVSPKNSKTTGVDKNKYSTKTSVITDLNKMKKKFHNEIEKILKKYGASEEQNPYKNRIHALEIENEKLKNEIDTLKTQLKKDQEKESVYIETKQQSPLPGRHRWTEEEEYLCAEEYIKCYVIKRNNIDLGSFVRKIRGLCPDISEGSLGAKIQNIKWVCSTEGVSDTFPVGGLANASIGCKNAVKNVLKKYKLK